tara:strand:- start:1499 stop:1750 length:252 start_codon:yes stop_codon:yes gene_type:complete
VEAATKIIKLGSVVPYVGLALSYSLKYVIAPFAELSKSRVYTVAEALTKSDRPVFSRSAMSKDRTENGLETPELATATAILFS